MFESKKDQIDKRLKENYTLLESNPDGNVWVCKEKIDYDSLYEALIEIHKKLRKGTMR